METFLPLSDVFLLQGGHARDVFKEVILELHGVGPSQT